MAISLSITFFDILSSVPNQSVRLPCPLGKNRCLEEIQLTVDLIRQHITTLHVSQYDLSYSIFNVDFSMSPFIQLHAFLTSFIQNFLSVVIKKIF